MQIFNTLMIIDKGEQLDQLPPPEQLSLVSNLLITLPKSTMTETVVSLVDANLLPGSIQSITFSANRLTKRAWEKLLLVSKKHSSIHFYLEDCKIISTPPTLPPNLHIASVHKDAARLFRKGLLTAENSNTESEWSNGTFFTTNDKALLMLKKAHYMGHPRAAEWCDKLRRILGELAYRCEQLEKALTYFNPSCYFVPAIREDALLKYRQVEAMLVPAQPVQTAHDQSPSLVLGG